MKRRCQKLTLARLVSHISLESAAMSADARTESQIAMPARQKTVGRALIVVTACLLTVSCISLGGPSTRLPVPAKRGGSEIVVASFDFPESVLLAELYAGILEERDFPVTRLFNLGSRETVDPALFQGHVDFVPEYLGTALTFTTLGRSTPASNTKAMVRRLATALRPNGVSVIEPARAQNQNGIVVTRETASRYGLDSISDLRDEAARLVFGGPPECPERPLCLPGLEERYRLNFRRFLPLDVSGQATVTALETGEVDVALLFTTDPDIIAHDFVVLEDDRDLQPAENVVPIVRSDVLDRYGDAFSNAVLEVTSRLTTSHLRELNRKIELQGLPPGKVAQEWLTGEGVVE
jgi:osmoprotectant transport system substrate-binding protein